jgi:aminopeptidase N
VDYTDDRTQNPTPPVIELPPGTEWPLKTWIDTPDGFAVMSQPDRAHLVFPSNDHPSDKATFTFRVTTPADRTAVANGTLRARDEHDGVATSVYRTAHPIPTDVVQIAVGRFREVGQTGPDGLPVRSYLALAPANGVQLTDAMERTASETPAQLAWLAGEISRQFPFERYGVLGLASEYDDVALETATLSTFGGGLSLAPEKEAPTLVHEMTHQYFGDAVSVRDWDDMWLSEGHARYYERRYAAERGLIDMDDELKNLYERDQQQRTLVGPMGRLKQPTSVLFETDVPGQLMLTGLRTMVGDDVFRRIEQTFFDRFRDRSASAQDYIDVANRVSGRNLTRYFHDWLYSPTTPPMPGHPDWHSAPADGA